LDLIDSLIHVAPADQPTRVRQIAERLFPAYRVDGGSIHLAGCRLESCLFARLRFQLADKSIEVFIDSTGKAVDSETIKLLGMYETIELEKPPEVFEPQITHAIDLGGPIAKKQFMASDSDEHGDPELVDACAVWCSFVRGKLRFTIGDQSVDLSFKGWARTLEPPPFVCPHSGARTFHLAATDDGRIVDADQIEQCDETGRRLLSEDLVSCSVTGKRLVADLVDVCPVSGKNVFRKEMVNCTICRQRVSPATTFRGVCAACRQLKAVKKVDPRMARVLDEHSLLDRWRDWRISETAADYILVAHGFFKRLLVVVDKDSLELKELATGSRFGGEWSPVERSEFDSVLRL